MLDSARPLNDLAEAGMPPARTPQPRPEQKLYVKLPSRSDPMFRHLSLLLTMFPGEQQLVIWCEREKKKIGTRCLLHRALVEELQELLGAENVVLR